jgi:hypothetical protein
MKKIILLFGFLTLVATCMLAQKKDEVAIKKLLDDESTFFYNRQFDKWGSCYVQNNNTYWSCIEKGDVVLEAISWSKIVSFVGGYIADNPTPEIVKLKKENYSFKPYGKAIWVSFDETKTKEGKSEKFRNTRIVEKVNGQWKIIYMNSYPMP